MLISGTSPALAGYEFKVTGGPPECGSLLSPVVARWEAAYATHDAKKVIAVGDAVLFAFVGCQLALYDGELDFPGDPTIRQWHIDFSTASSDVSLKLGYAALRIKQYSGARKCFERGYDDARHVYEMRDEKDLTALNLMRKFKKELDDLERQGY